MPSFEYVNFDKNEFCQRIMRGLEVYGLSLLPLADSTPVLIRAVAPSGAPAPPPLKPALAPMVMELLANWLLLALPFNCPVFNLPVTLLAVLAKMSMHAECTPSSSQGSSGLAEGLRTTTGAPPVPRDV